MRAAARTPIPVEPQTRVARRLWVVAPPEAGKRVDLYLAARLPELSRTRIQELIEGGYVRLDGKAARRSHRVVAGERIEVEVTPRPPLEAVPEAIPLDILYEDEDVVAVNKPAGMAVHAGAGQTRGTLVNALLHHLQSLSTVGGPLRPGIVHRLDRDTSGVLLVARTDAAHQRLAEDFQARRIEKTYLALVHGRLERDAGTIARPIARDSRRRTRMTARRREGREARTDWRVLVRLDGFTLLEVHPQTGRTHQIRAHLSALGHPIVGDTLYGAARQIRVGSDILAPLGRIFLHAARVRFAHPRTGTATQVRAPLAAELRAYLERLVAALGKGGGAIDAALRGFL